MKDIWSTTKLSEVLKPVSRPISVNPMEEYRLLGIRLDGGGVFHRETKTGSQISANTLFRVWTGDFIYSRLFAWRGAFGIINPSLNGCYVSSEFPTFKSIKEKIDIDFLRLWFLLPSTVGIVEADCSGSTPLTRNRFKEHFFLNLEIPLPPLEEQHHIVARVQELAAKVEEARGLRKETVEACDSLCRAIIFYGLENKQAMMTPMRELVELRETDVKVEQNKTYHFAGVYCFGKGVFKGQSKSGMEFAYNRLTRLQTGNFVYPKLMAWEGALGVVPPGCDGLVVSPEFPVFKINQGRVLPETLDVYFRTPSIWPTLSSASTGTNVRRRRLNPADFLKLELPLPSMEKQLQLRAIKSGVDAVKQLQAETRAELDALLPSVLDKAFRGELV